MTTQAGQPYTNPVAFGGEVVKVSKTEDGYSVRLATATETYDVIVDNDVVASTGVVPALGQQMRVVALKNRKLRNWSAQTVQIP